MQIQRDSEGPYVHPREFTGVHNFDPNGSRLVNFLVYIETTMSSRYKEKYGSELEMSDFDFFHKCGEALSKGSKLYNVWTAPELSDRIKLYEQVSGLFTARGQQEREDITFVINVAAFRRDNS